MINDKNELFTGVMRALPMENLQYRCIKLIPLNVQDSKLKSWPRLYMMNVCLSPYLFPVNKQRLYDDNPTFSKRHGRLENFG